MASPTVVIFSASSSGISRSNSSSTAITSSTVSSESAPRSSMNFAAGSTSSSSTPSCSTMISFTRSSTGFAMTSPLTAIELKSLPTLPPLPEGESGLRSRLHVQPAVDVDRLPGDVARPVAGQEPHHFRHLAPLADALERDLLDQRLTRLRGERGRHVGLDQPRRHRVHQD